jgi:ABC-type nitrate/sulfonate/bicarbonate transport system substrate-binding protein
MLKVMQINRRLAMTVALCIAICAAFVAASGSGAAEKKKTKVLISVSTPVAHLLVPYLAEEKGLFDKQNIDAEVKLLPPPQDLAGLASGSTQFAIAGAPQFDLVAKKAPIKIIGTWATKQNMVFLGNVGVNKASDLKGKPFGVAPKGNQSWVMAQRWFLDEGMSITDVDAGAASSSTVAVALWQAGKLAGSSATPPLQQIFLAQRPGAKIIHRATDPWTQAEISVNSSWAKKHRAATVAVLRALDAGVKLWLKDPAAAKAVITKQTGLKDPKLLSSTYNSTKSIFLKGVRAVTPAHEARILSIVASVGLKGPNPAHPEDVIDGSYAKAMSKKK